MKGNDTVYPGVCTPCMRINSYESERAKESTVHVRATDEIFRLNRAVSAGLVTEGRAARLRKYFESFLQQTAE